MLARFTIERGRRPDGGMAPCPICSPHTDKYLSGVLIWCRETAAIYAIGYECADSVFGIGQLQRAINLHDMQRDRHQLEDLLLERVPKVPALRAYGQALVAPAREADQIGTALRKLTRLKRLLVRAARNGYEVHGTSDSRQGDVAVLGPMIGGASFSRGKWDLVQRLGFWDARLGVMDAGQGEAEALEFVCGFTSNSERKKALAFINDALAEFAEIEAVIRDVRAFLEPANIEALRAWSLHPGGPGALSVFTTTNWFKIVLGNETWYQVHPRAPLPAARPILWQQGDRQL